MQTDHEFWLFRNLGGRLAFDYYATLGTILKPAYLSPSLTFLTRTKEEGFELASLFLVHGIANPVQIFDAETERVLANDFLTDGPNKRHLVLTWKPNEAEWIRRNYKTEIYLRLT